MEVVADHAKRVIAMTQGQIVADGQTIEVLRNRDAVSRAHLLEPQIIEISMKLADMPHSEKLENLCRANTVDEMIHAIAAYKNIDPAKVLDVKRGA